MENNGWTYSMKSRGCWLLSSKSTGKLSSSRSAANTKLIIIALKQTCISVVPSWVYFMHSHILSKKNSLCLHWPLSVMSVLMKVICYHGYWRGWFWFLCGGSFSVWASPWTPNQNLQSYNLQTQKKKRFRHLDLTLAHKSSSWEEFTIRCFGTVLQICYGKHISFNNHIGHYFNINH